MNSYQALIDKQMLSVVKQALISIAKKQQFYSHEIYITFSTIATYINIAPKLRGLYPVKMSILIQQNYNTLQIHDKELEIELNLVTGLEKLLIPFNAIIEYLDNTEKFALKFTPIPIITNILEQTHHETNSIHAKVIQFKSE